MYTITDIESGELIEVSKEVHDVYYGILKKGFAVRRIVYLIYHMNITKESEDMVTNNTNNMFKEYRRKQKAELRPVTHVDCRGYHQFGTDLFDNGNKVSISKEDKKAGSPKLGDMIARNPKNHDDVWLVAEQYFKDNFEEIE